MASQQRSIEKAAYTSNRVLRRILPNLNFRLKALAAAETAAETAASALAAAGSACDMRGAAPFHII